MIDFQLITGLQLRDLVSRYINTGNAIIDLVIGIVAFRLLYSIGDIAQANFWQPLLDFYTWLMTSSRPLHRGQLEFSCSSDPSRNDTKTFFGGDISAQYKAIMHKIAKIDDDTILKLRECFVDFCDCDDEDSAWPAKESFYECVQETPFQLEKEIFVKVEETETVAQNQGKFSQRTLILYSDRYSPYELSEFVSKWVEEYDEFRKSKTLDQQMLFSIRFDNEGRDQVQATPFHTFRSFDNFHFEHKERVMSELDFFASNRHWYEQRGLHYALGILCYGEPGCGKTSFIKALLRHTRRHAVVFSINQYANLETIGTLMSGNMIGDFPVPQENRLYIFEDIDAMGETVHKRKGQHEESSECGECDEEEESSCGDGKSEELERRKNSKQNNSKAPPFLDNEALLLELLLKGDNDKSGSKHLLFSKFHSNNSNHLGFLLNLIDGVIEAPGRIMVMTTNYVDKLDDALIRPGRIDLKLRFRSCSRRDVVEIVSLFYDCKPDEIRLPDDFPEFVITPARVSQICRSNKHKLESAVKLIVDDCFRLKKGKANA